MDFIEKVSGWLRKTKEYNKLAFFFLFLGVILGSIFTLIRVSQAEFKGTINRFGRINILASLEQAVKIDNKEFSEEIERTIKNISGGETAFLGAHYLKNESSLPLEVVLLTDDNPENLSPSPVKSVWQSVQITTDRSYKRNPAILKDKEGSWWLFFAKDRYSSQDGKGCDEKGVDCNNHQYEIYYSISPSKRFSFSSPAKLVEMADFYPKEISVVEDKTGRIWAFFSNDKNKKEIRYLKIEKMSEKIGEVRQLQITAEHPDHIWVASRGDNMALFYENEGEGVKMIYSRDLGENWNGPVLIDKRGGQPKGIIDNQGKIRVVWQDRIHKRGIYLTTCEDWKNCYSVPVSFADGPEKEKEEPFIFEDSLNNFWIFWVEKEGRTKGDITKWINFATSSDGKTFSLPAVLIKRENRWNFWPVAFKDNEGRISVVFSSENNKYSSEGRINSNIWLAKLGKEMKVVIPPNEKLGIEASLIFKNNIAGGNYKSVFTTKIKD